MMDTTHATFHGTKAEGVDLVYAVQRNCTCDPASGTPLACPAHRMLTLDQRALDGLLTSRRRAAELVREEHSR
jgi:hypothetical protein